MVNLKAKAKKRCVVFRFKTSRGPPILELTKEDSKRNNKEELDLSVSNSIEVWLHKDTTREPLCMAW